jgi:putative glutathione S-transferase
VASRSSVHPSFHRTRPDDPTDDHCGWIFKAPSDPPLPNNQGKGAVPCDDCIPDSVNGCKNVRELCECLAASLGFTVMCCDVFL